MKRDFILTSEKPRNSTKGMKTLNPCLTTCKLVVRPKIPQIFAPMLFIFLLLLMIFACGEERQLSNNSEQVSDVPNIENQAVNTIEVFGNVKISKYKNISLDFPVRIEKIHVMPGQYISQNDSLITLNIDEYYNQIKIKEHELVIEELRLLNLEQEYAQKNQDVNTRYMTLRNSIDIVEQEIEQLKNEYSEKIELLGNRTDPEIQRLENEIEQAYQEFFKAEEEFERKNILFAESAISEQEYKESSFIYNQKELAAANLEYLLTSSELIKSRELEQMQLTIFQKNANLDDLRLEIENLNTPEITQIEIQKETCNLLKNEIYYLTSKLGQYYKNNNEIRTDIANGIVYEILCTEGDSISAGQNLLSIIDSDSLYVEASVPEEFIKDIQLGNEAFIIPLADQDRKYSGNITYIGSMAIESRGETIVPVHIRVNDNDGFLLPNFNVDIEIIPAIIQE